VLRRIVGAHSLVHPITERHLFPWRRRAAISADHKAMKRWHGLNRPDRDPMEQATSRADRPLPV